jgi:hypothetical protein
MLRREKMTVKVSGLDGHKNFGDELRIETCPEGVMHAAMDFLLHLSVDAH